MTLSQYTTVLDVMAANGLIGPMLLHFDYGQTFTGYPVTTPLESGLVVFSDLAPAAPDQLAKPLPPATYRFISLGAIVSIELQP